jgi:hypothetical protein
VFLQVTNNSGSIFYSLSFEWQSRKRLPLILSNLRKTHDFGLSKVSTYQVAVRFTPNYNKPMYYEATIFAYKKGLVT